MKRTVCQLIISIGKNTARGQDILTSCMGMCEYIYFFYKSLISECECNIYLTIKIPFLDVNGDIDLVGLMIKSHKACRFYLGQS